MVKTSSKKLYFPLYRQHDTMDCGPTCLRMIAQYYGRNYSANYLRTHCHIDREGVSMHGIGNAAEKIGFRTLSVKVPFTNTGEIPGLMQAPLPLIAHWQQRHFVVVFRISRRFVWIADPAGQKIRLKRSEFLDSWLSDGDKGVAMLLELTPHFYEEENPGERKRGFGTLFSYLRPQRRMLVQLGMGMGLSAILTLFAPFLTQSVVDNGIALRDLSFIYVVLLGQFMLFAGQMAIRFIQSWILLRVSSHINISLISDFLAKLMRLPLGFFDSKMTGDLLQRIGDHHRIQSFLTSSALSVILSLFNLVMFGGVLAWYSLPIFTVFAIAAAAYTLWVAFFLKKRKEIDYLSFRHQSRNQDALLEIIQGMPEIKLQGSRQKRRDQWLDIQIKLLRAQMRSLNISQYQDLGGLGINQLKDIFITFLAAQAVMAGQMTLGMMLAVQYIVGQLNGPLQQLIGFLRSAQDTRISLERLNEIHEQENEDAHDDSKSPTIPTQGDIHLDGVRFRYNPLSEWVLDNLTLNIPRGKVTAIVGASGSGKTTLLKLLLGFYHPQKGSIRVGATLLNQIQSDAWRGHCGAVLQDGYLFSDTIANNISESARFPDSAQLDQSVRIANIRPYIESLPLGFNTMIGARGNGVSQGQRQRLLIARAVYKDPAFLFFDEATNALDANNEKEIIEQLDNFFQGRTVIVVAHRLSTVRHADQIVVLDQGKIVELGTHEELTEKRGAYYTLVKNQLELGK
ncbi:peptidase domain-containing ABC transporter [Haliscomenobacter sp.]|uniref:peptidase domain-containing ABC transporter n=1 Tax=Haliscomenobacter sp. TaxID=2717303 RepID=UPI0035937681